MRVKAKTICHPDNMPPERILPETIYPKTICRLETTCHQGQPAPRQYKTQTICHLCKTCHKGQNATLQYMPPGETCTRDNMPPIQNISSANRHNMPQKNGPPGEKWHYIHIQIRMAYHINLLPSAVSFVFVAQIISLCILSK